MLGNKIGVDKIKINSAKSNIELVNPDLDVHLLLQKPSKSGKTTEELGYIIPKVRFEK